MGVERSVEQRRDDFLASSSDAVGHALYDTGLRLVVDEGFCGQDGYELLSNVFGNEYEHEDLANPTDATCEKFAAAVTTQFETDLTLTHEEVRTVLGRAHWQSDPAE